MQTSNRRTLATHFATLLLTLCAVLNAYAVQSPTTRPAEIVETISDARAVGSTRLKVFGFQIYDARLWAQPDFDAQVYPNSTFALEINYLRKFDNGAVAERSIQEMRKLGNLSEADAAQWLTQMRNIFPDIAKGDRLVGIHLPGVGAAFTFNGKPVGQIKNPEFAKQFFGIWLSPKTSQPQMRRDLIGASATPAAKP
jgi:Chalcone isomerase-like